MLSPLIDELELIITECMMVGRVRIVQLAEIQTGMWCCVLGQ